MSWGLEETVEKRKTKKDFRTAKLLFHESVRVVELYVESRDWERVRAQVLDENLFQSRSSSSLRLLSSEVIARLQHLSDEELLLFLEVPPKEQAYWLWLALCRLYPLIAEFAQKVLHLRYISYKGKLSYGDFDAFFSEKRDWDPEYKDASEYSRKKLRSVLFAMMKEAHLISFKNEIQPAFLGASMVRHLVDSSLTNEMAYFPIFPEDAQRMLR